jgi:AcrR family transcriptional regulator
VTVSNISPIGRRPKGSDTKKDIARAARTLFAAHGYDKTTLRAVALRAEVDPALIVHYFGSKQSLFTEVMLPFHLQDKEIVLEKAVPDIDLRDLAQAFAELIARKLDNAPRRQILLGILRAAASEPKAAEMVRTQITRSIIKQLVPIFGEREAELRTSLIGSQLVGFVMAGYIIKMPSLSGLSRQEIIDYLTPTFYHYLTVELQ